MFNFILNIIFWLFPQRLRYRRQKGFVLTAMALAFSIGFVLGFANIALGTVGTAIAIGVSIVGSLAIWGGVALSKSQGGKKNIPGISDSLTYGNNVLQTQTNNQLPAPLVYGKVKLAGNKLYQNDGSESSVNKIIAFSEGEINGYSEIKINDEDYATFGATVRKYYGADSQLIDSLVPGAANADKAEVIGGLKNIAYLAISVAKQDKIDVNYNVTAMVEGRKVRKYTTPSAYTVAYSNNPAWCLLDFLTAYNGAGIGLNDDGSRNDADIAKFIDIQSFIEAAAYCDGQVVYYEYTTALAGNNNDLIWKARQAGASALTVSYVNPGVPNAVASVNLNGNKITVNLGTNSSSAIKTTAAEIVSLINNDSDILKLIRVYNADDNDGSGIVTALAETHLVAGAAKSRFSFNFIFDSSYAVRDAIEEFKKNCRGALTVKGEKLQFKLDKPEDVSKIFTPDDIIYNSEIFHAIPVEEHYDILRVEFVDINNESSKVQAQAELEVYKNTPAVIHNVDIYSITDFDHAARMAWYYLNDKVLCPYFGQFSTGYKASDLEVGDVIQLTDTLMGFVDYKVKVTSVVDDGTGVFDVFWRTYNEDIYNDEMGSIEPVIIKTNINNPYAFPADISNFNVIQNLRLLQFTWQEINDSKITYEIREGESWINSTLVASGIKGGSYTHNLSKKGTLKFWIKAYSGYSYSENAIFDVIQVDTLPDLNIVVDQAVFEDSSAGTFTNTYIYNNRLKLNPVALWDDISPEKWQNSGDRYYADRNNLWGSQVETAGEYVSEIYDIGANLNSVVSSNYNVYKISSLASVAVEWRYSEDSIVWSDYKLINTGSYQFRYYQIKVTIINPEATPVMVSNLVVSVDVPDREENYTNREITSAENGVTINFATDVESKQAENFIISEPQILATSKSGSAYAVVSHSDSSGCAVKLYNNSGVLTTGFVNIRARGY